MKPAVDVHRKSLKKKKTPDQLKEQEQLEIDALNQKLAAELHFTTPPTRFTDLPLSSRTIRGLQEAHFIELTDIQKCALPVALTGVDILGAAKTGSGKTLAFLLPVLERLYRERWSRWDGLGALILSPTRELALQTFEVLRRIGRHHALSAGLVIGGKDLKAEQDAIARMNILVATPGRLLQHLDQTVSFNWNNLKVLVLDEADRILDLGFARTVDAILQALPRSRQTLLFSATPPYETSTSSTPSIKDDSVAQLARLSLQDPVLISVHQADSQATPQQLQQKFITCPLHEKLDRLYSFIKDNLRSKLLIFLSSCKQVRFVFEAFCRLQPGIPLLQLHGRQKQLQRLAIFQDFNRRTAACLIATDVAARGLDFPAVDWVIQGDCPEDEATYIHRVGRTARLDRPGNALLFLLPSEMAMLERLKARKVPLVPFYAGSNSNIPPPKRPIHSKLQALCSQDPEIKYLAQKALISYVRSVYLNGLKEVFQVESLPVDAFATSLGLASTPRLRFAAKSMAKNKSRQLEQVAAEEESQIDCCDDEDDEYHGNNNIPSQARKVDKMFKRKNPNVFSSHYAKLQAPLNDYGDGGNIDEMKPQHGKSSTRIKDDDDDEPFLKIKRRHHDIDSADLESVHKKTFSRRDVLKTKKKYLFKDEARPTRLVFDEEGKGSQVFAFQPESVLDNKVTQRGREIFVREAQANMQQVDREDAARERQVKRKARLEKKRKIKERELVGRNNKIPRLASAVSDDTSD